MKTDSIVAEVRHQRQAILKSYDGDFERMSRDAMVRQWESGHRVVSRGRKPPQQDAAPNAYPLRRQA
jgi:hypothetical protein